MRLNNYFRDDFQLGSEKSTVREFFWGSPADFVRLPTDKEIISQLSIMTTESIMSQFEW